MTVIPVQTSISIPAVLQASSYATIFAPTPGRLQQVLVRDGQVVKAGDPLVILENPSLEKEVRLAETKVGRRESHRVIGTQRVWVSPGGIAQRAGAFGYSPKAEAELLAMVFAMCRTCGSPTSTAGSRWFTGGWRARS